MRPAASSSRPTGPAGVADRVTRPAGRRPDRRSRTPHQALRAALHSADRPGHPPAERDARRKRPMSSPTGPDPNYPQGGAPQGQPGWGAPAAAGAGLQPAPAVQPRAPVLRRTRRLRRADRPAARHGHRRRRSSASSGAPWAALRPARAQPSPSPSARSSACWSCSPWSSSAALLVGGHPGDPGQVPAAAPAISYARSPSTCIDADLGARSQGGFVFSGLLGFILPGVIVFLLMQPQSKQYYAARGISY